MTATGGNWAGLELVVFPFPLTPPRPVFSCFSNALFGSGGQRQGGGQQDDQYTSGMDDQALLQEQRDTMRSKYRLTGA
jgi:hypothetical protein